MAFVKGKKTPFYHLYLTSAYMSHGRCPSQMRDGIFCAMAFVKGKKTPLNHLYLTSSHGRCPLQMRDGIFGPFQIRDDDRAIYMQMLNAHGKGATAFCTRMGC